MLPSNIDVAFRLTLCKICRLAVPNLNLPLFAVWKSTFTNKDKVTMPRDSHGACNWMVSKASAHGRQENIRIRINKPKENQAEHA
jgi:hypothetical protein